MPAAPESGDNPCVRIRGAVGTPKLRSPYLWQGLAATSLRATRHGQKKKTGVITAQLTLHQALQRQHFDASDSNRQALKRHPVANEHSGSARQTCIGWTI